MKKYIVLLSIISALFFTLCSSSCHKNTLGCKDPTAKNYDIGADESCSGCCIYPPKQGGVLFFLADPNVIPRCGNLLITLSNGKQSIISGYYPIAPPANCINQVGGYFLLDVGTYQYTITSGNCAKGTGSITVVEGCNRVPL